MVVAVGREENQLLEVFIAISNLEGGNKHQSEKTPWFTKTEKAKNLEINGPLLPVHFNSNFAKQTILRNEKKKKQMDIAEIMSQMMRYVWGGGAVRRLPGGCRGGPQIRAGALFH